MNNPDTPPVLPLSVRFSISRWDVLRCRLWAIVHSRKLMAILFLMCLPLPAVMCNPPPGTQSPVVFSIFSFLVVLAFELGLMAIFQVFVHSLWILVNKNRGVVGEHVYEIRDDGLFEKTPFNESLYRWAGFHKITASGSSLFVFVTENNVHYIPFSTFPTREAAHHFEAELRKRANIG